MNDNYTFRVYDIDWTASDDVLPSEIVICLPGWLVLSDDASDEDWDEVINDKLEECLGARASDFSFDPADEA